MFMDSPNMSISQRQNIEYSVHLFMKVYIPVRHAIKVENKIIINYVFSCKNIYTKIIIMFTKGHVFIYSIKINQITSLSCFEK